MDAGNIAVSLKRLSEESLEDAIAWAHAMGFSAITFDGTASSDPVPPGFFWPDLSAEERERLLAVRDQFERAVIHAPYVDVPFVSVNPYIERESLRQALGSIEAAGALRLEVVTIHAGLPYQSIPAEEFFARLVPILRMLGDAAAVNGTRIGVENWRYPADPDQHAALLQAVDHPAVGATLDLGHIAYWLKRDGFSSLDGPAAIEDYNARLLVLIDRLGDQIIHVHAHDVRPVDIDDHRPAGTGIIDFEAVFARLNAIGFDGLVLLEIKPDGSDCAQAIAASRERLLRAMKAAAAA